MRKKLFSIFMTVILILSTITTGSIKADPISTNDIKGNLIILGGALESTNSEVYNKFIELAGGKDMAKVAIIPAASSKPTKYGELFKNDLISYGVKERNIYIAPIALKDDSTTLDIDESKWIENVNKQEIADKIKECTAVWFIGGDQERITTALYNSDSSNTKTLDTIWEIYKNGGVIGGTSAGAAIMSEPMILDGDSLGALNEGVIDAGTNINKYEFVPPYVVRGLGFFKYGMIDQHFDKRSRLGRLIVAVNEKGNKKQLAYGIDENTAMVVNNNNETAEILGSGGITIVDLTKAVQDPNNDLFDMTNIRVSYLTKGDKINFKTKEISINPSKDLTNGYEYYNFKPPVNTGVFTSYNIFKKFIAYDLVDNAAADEIKSYSYDSKGQGYEIAFKKDSETKGYWAYSDGNIDDYSAVNVIMSLKPINVKIKNDFSSGKFNSSNFKPILPRVNREDIKGRLVIVGGALGSSNVDVYNKFIDLGKGKDNCKIGIIPAASSSLKSSKAFKYDLVKYGALENNIEIIPIAITDDKSTKDVDESKWIENVNKPEIAEKLKSYTAIWFVGGDQTKITTALLNKDGSNTLALDAIWDMYKSGGVLGGTSAGAAVMSSVMIGGGDSLGAINEGFTENYTNSDQQEYGPVYLTQGLGFFGYGIIDQHFDSKARLGRLIMTAMEKGDKTQFAYGIDENTAMIVDNINKKIQICGKGSITVVDTSKAVRDKNKARVNLKDIYISVIDQGDELTLMTKEFVINPEKDLTNGYEYNNYTPTAVTGVLSSHNTVKDLITYDLVDNSKGDLVKSYCFDEKGIGSEVIFRKTKDTKGYWKYLNGTMDDYSAVNVAVDINSIAVIITNRIIKK